MIYVLVIVLILLAGLGVFFWYSIPDYSPIRQVEKLYFPETDEHIYITTEVWGVSYDRQIIIISTKARTRLDYQESEDYVFQAETPVFYEAHDDSLVVYTHHQSPVPEHFGSEVQIKQVVLGIEEIEEMTKNYKTMGLKKAGEIE